jgi:hypothetical protein
MAPDQVADGPWPPFPGYNDKAPDFTGDRATLPFDGATPPLIFLIIKLLAFIT